MKPDKALERLRAALSEAVYRSRHSSRELSERMGRHPGYLSRVLTGRLHLKVVETVELLELLGIDPVELLEIAFPFGGDAAQASRAPGGVGRFRAEVPGLQELVEQVDLEDPREPLSSRELAERARRVLRLALRRRGLTQRAVSRRLGRSQDALGLAFRGNTRLTFWHVFATLDQIGMSPQRFFAELFGPADADITAGLRWTAYLDALEPLAGKSATALRGRGKKAPREGREAGEGDAEEPTEEN